jgi:dUTP pyrophosphatase
LFLAGSLIAASIVLGYAEDAVQPAGVDLTIASVEKFQGAGVLGRTTRSIPEGERVEPSGGYYHLEPGAYRVRFSEIVKIPEWGVGFCYPRSSLLRMGAFLACAVWDPGYVGRGSSLLIVANPHGVKLEAGARIAQLVIARLETLPSSVYEGVYRGEGLEAEKS